MATYNSLRTDFLGSQFDNPLVVASGTLTETFEQAQRFIEVGAGSVIPRSTRLHVVREVHPSPHLFQSRENMINAEWTGADITYWRPYLEELGKQNPKVIMSISGRNIADCVTVCRELDQYNFPILEINVSCAASSGVHGQITRDQEFVKQLCDSIKNAGVKTPISMKLGHSDGIIEVAGSAKEAGADAITAINTLGPVLDFYIDENGKPQRVVGISGAKGGLSGSAIFNTALTDVAEISRQIEIPVMASGGIMKPEDAVKMVMAGAGLVQLYTVLHRHGISAPRALTSFREKLLDYMDAHNIQALSNVRGSALSLMEEETELTPQIPTVNAMKCIGCIACTQVCLPGAIKLPVVDGRKIVRISDEQCVGCGHCVSVCPKDALSL